MPFFSLLKKLYYVKLLKQKKKLLFKYIDDIDTPVLLHDIVRLDQIEFNLSRKRFKRPAAHLLRPWSVTIIIHLKSVFWVFLWSMFWNVSQPKTLASPSKLYMCHHISTICSLSSSRYSIKHALLKTGHLLLFLMGLLTCFSDYVFSVRMPWELQ